MNDQEYLMSLINIAHLCADADFCLRRGDVAQLCDLEDAIEGAVWRLANDDYQRNRIRNDSPVLQAYGLWRFYLEVVDFLQAEEDEHFRIALLNEVYPTSVYAQTLYCARGCNQVTGTQGWDECPACGCIMTADSEERYYQTLIREAMHWCE